MKYKITYYEVNYSQQEKKETTVEANTHTEAIKIAAKGMGMKPHELQANILDIIVSR